MLDKLKILRYLQELFIRTIFLTGLKVFELCLEQLQATWILCLPQALLWVSHPYSRNALLGQCKVGHFVDGTVPSDLSLAIQLLLEAKDMAPNYKYLGIRLRLEQLRLHNWGLESGLHEQPTGESLFSDQHLAKIRRHVVLDTILQIRSLVLDFIKHQKKIGALIPDESSTHPPGEEIPLMLSPSFPNILQPLADGFHSKLNGDLAQRLRWTFFYKDRFERFVNRFRELNDALIDLVDRDTRIAICKSTRETHAMMLHTHTRIEELMDLVTGSRPASMVNSSGLSELSSRYTESTALQQQQDLADLAFLKAVNKALDENTPITSDGWLAGNIEGKDLKLSRSNICVLKTRYSTEERCQAEYQLPNSQKRRVWIEWREFDANAQLEDSPNRSTLTRIEKLVALLSNPKRPDLLRVPRCYGYFYECDDHFDRGRSRLGFLLEIPTDSAMISPISLHQVMESQEKPDLTSRIALARGIADCLMSLHSINWLHKGLRCHNVIFFSEDIDRIDYSRPYLSGFGYARPAFREDLTETPSQNPVRDMYKHPDVQGYGPCEGRRGFKRSFDIYSLGIVLAEIASWQTIDSLLNIEDPYSLTASSLAGIQQKLLVEQHVLDVVAAHAGLIYQAATRSCLMGAEGFDVDAWDDETDVRVAAKLSSRFFSNVLRPLEQIRI